MPGVHAKEQPIDLRQVRAALRRQWRLLVVSACVGWLLGLIAAFIFPPQYSSTSLVLIGSATDTGSATDRSRAADVATQAEIVLSEPVLDSVIKDKGLDLTVRDLRDKVSVSTPTSSLIEIEASASSDADAELVATAIAESYLDFITRAGAPLSADARTRLEQEAEALRGQSRQLDQEIAKARARQAALKPASAQSQHEAELIATLTAQRADVAVQISQIEQDLTVAGTAAPATVSAHIVQDGSAATRTDPLVHGLLYSLAGMVLGLLAGVLLALRRDRRDPTIRSVAALTGALGLPVLAELGSHPQKDPEAWRRLLATYEPPPPDAWAVRRALRTLGVEGTPASDDSSGEHREPTSIALVSCESDPRAQSLGPVIAATIASLGVRTSLLGVGAPETSHELWAGLALAHVLASIRVDLDIVRSAEECKPGGVLLSLVVVDPSEPALDEVPPANEHLLCVSPGAVTIDDLARLALAADAAGRRFSGLVVADPDDWDQQGGTAHERAVQPPSPAATVTSLRLPLVSSERESAGRQS